MDEYIKVIRGAYIGDRKMIVDHSRTLGFLTGYESPQMEEAHTDAVMILGEALASQTPFDFGAQSTTARIQKVSVEYPEMRAVGYLSSDILNTQNDGSLTDYKSKFW